MANNEIREATPETTTAEAPRPRRPRQPKPELRPVQDLCVIPPSKMSDAEKNTLIEFLVADNKNMYNKNQELDVSYRKLHEAAKTQDENFRRFVAEHNARMQYASDIMRMAYQSIKMASEGQ